MSLQRKSRLPGLRRIVMSHVRLASVLLAPSLFWHLPCQAQAAPARAADCATVTGDIARLACYDRWFGSPGPVAGATPTAAAEMPNPAPSRPCRHGLRPMHRLPVRGRRGRSTHRCSHATTILPLPLTRARHWISAGNSIRSPGVAPPSCVPTSRSSCCRCSGRTIPIRRPHRPRRTTA